MWEGGGSVCVLRGISWGGCEASGNPFLGQNARGPTVDSQTLTIITQASQKARRPVWIFLQWPMGAGGLLLVWGGMEGRGGVALHGGHWVSLFASHCK